ncbi:MAG: hypothetical protein LLG20_15495 [Acidobacteriales bacterium]|nr:hypothetical protein [Terriglobales bacterium]
MWRVPLITSPYARRTSTTQTQTFTHNTLGQLVTTTNPENGTTTLAYNTDGMIASKTDQKGQRIEYTYDSYRWVTQVKKYPAGQQSDDPCQRVSYFYDTNPYDSWLTQNAWGRLAVASYGDSDYSCTGGKYRESYSYTAGGLPVKKKSLVD